jgi:protein subunit release factor B
MTENTQKRDQILTLEDKELLQLCKIDTFVGRGPGGQKRNKTETAVRVTHLQSGISASNDESRSQHLNLIKATQALRLEIAANIRQEAEEWQAKTPGINSKLYPLWLAKVLDAMEETDYKISEAAKILNTSTAQLSKDIARSPNACQIINQGRTRNKLSPLKWK